MSWQLFNDDWTEYENKVVYVQYQDGSTSRGIVYQGQGYEVNLSGTDLFSGQEPRYEKLVLTKIEEVEPHRRQGRITKLQILDNEVGLEQAVLNALNNNISKAIVTSRIGERTMILPIKFG